MLTFDLRARQLSSRLMFNQQVKYSQTQKILAQNGKNGDTKIFSYENFARTFRLKFLQAGTNFFLKHFILM